MPEIKFGTAQIKNPTPATLNKVVRIITIICGILLGWMQTAAFIPANVQAPISSLLGLIMAVLNGIAPLFGVETPQQEIPKEQVTAMEINSNEKKD